MHAELNLPFNGLWSLWSGKRGATDVYECQWGIVKTFFSYAFRKPFLFFKSTD